MRLNPVVASLAVLSAWLGPAAFAAQAPKLSEVHTVYVDSFGNAEGADLIREKVIHQLVKSGKVTILPDPDQADAILTGRAESTQGFSFSEGRGRTSYDATVALRLLGRDNAILWADDAKPGGFFVRSASTRVAENIVESLLDAIKKDAKTKKPVESQASPPPAAAPSLNASGPPTETLTNADVIAMVTAGLGSAVILEKIATTPAVFDLTTNAIIELKKAGVQDDVLAKMLQIKGTPPRSASPAPSRNRPL